MGSRSNGVKHREYNAAVKSELRAYAKENPERLDSAGDLKPSKFDSKHAEKFLDRLNNSSSPIIKAFNEGILEEVKYASEFGKEYFDRQFKLQKSQYPDGIPKNIELTLKEAARDYAHKHVLEARSITAKRLANVVTKFEGWEGFFRKLLGRTGRYVPILSGGIAYLYEEKSLNAAIAGELPLVGDAIVFGEALGSGFDELERDLNETTLRNKFSERWYMGSASSRETAKRRALDRLESEGKYPWE
jgi:hypothetical protein